MNCPFCNKPMTSQLMSTYVVLKSKRWYYKYETMFCDDHPQQAWQTEAQLQANLDAIKAVKEAAAKLKKAAK